MLELCQKALPTEIILKILEKCDYKSLKIAQCVNTQWRHLVNYIIQKRCMSEICPQKYLQITQKWIGTPETEQIYDNWISWQQMNKFIDIKSDIFHKNASNDENISCLSVKGGYVAIAKANNIKIYKNDSNLIQDINLNMDTAIDNLHLVSSDNGYPSKLIIVCFEINQIFIKDLSGVFKDTKFDCDYAFSAYGNYFSGIKDGVLKIAKIDNTTNNYTLLKSVEIDTNPLKFVSATISNHRVLILTKNMVKILEYLTNGGTVIDLCQLEYTVDYVTILEEFRSWIFQDEVLIILYWGLRSDDQVLDIYLLNNQESLKPVKTLIPFDVFQDEINYLTLYGNTLLVFFMHGAVVFYEITSWDKLDFQLYTKSMFIEGLTPIVGIEVEEFYRNRVFYVAGGSRVEAVLCRSNLED